MPARRPTAYPDPRDLLTRDEWRRRVLARSDGRCVLCHGPATEAHHLIARRLFADGGYYPDNGVALCDRGCHARAEAGEVTPEDLRDLAGIARSLYPLALARDDEVDARGNVIDGDGVLHPGPLFDETGPARRGGVAVSTREKYPRTPHLPGGVADAHELVLADDPFIGHEVVVTEKLDGECTTIGRDGDGAYCHARSLDTARHPTRSWVRRLAARVAGELDEGWRIVGENLQGVHTVRYGELPGYFLVFAVVDATRTFLSWDDVETIAGVLGLPVVPVLYRGPYDPARLPDPARLTSPYTDRPEGFVVRRAAAFATREFARAVAKRVAPGFTPATHHWTGRAVELNGLRAGAGGIEG